MNLEAQNQIGCSLGGRLVSAATLQIRRTGFVEADGLHRRVIFEPKQM